MGHFNLHMISGADGGVLAIKEDYYTASTRTDAMIKSRNCVYKMNKGSSSGGVFYMVATNILHSEHDVYLANTAPIGSVLQAIQGYTDVKMIGNMIADNIADDGTLYATDLSNLVIHNTTFRNNIAIVNVAVLLIENSIGNFSCTICMFMHNNARFDGLISINLARIINLDFISVRNNNAISGSMIQIKESIQIFIQKSYFSNNYCSDVACALSIINNEVTEIDTCFISSNLISDNNPSDKSTVDMKGRYVKMIHVVFMGIGGNILTAVSDQSIILQNISYSCPKKHHFETLFQTPFSEKGVILEGINKSSFAIKCVGCAHNQYRAVVSSYTIRNEVGIDSKSIKETDMCYKCPSGAICKDKTVVADVNYWGYVDGNEFSFVYCSVGHCCQSSPCDSYDSCSEGRIGKLCTSCRDGYQLVVSNDACILSEYCVDSWIYAVIIVSGIVYVLTFFIKVEFLNVLQIVYLKIVSYCQEKA